MLCFSIVSNLKSKTFFEKSRRLSRKSIQNITNSDYPLNHRRRKKKDKRKKEGKKERKKLKRKKKLFVDFSKAFDSIQREKLEQILLTNGLPPKIVTTIMMLYKNTYFMATLTSLTLSPVSCKEIHHPHIYL